jgi:very-short-patch-repair endonuclease
MKIRDLNNQIHKWNLQGYVVRANDQRPRSKLHLKARVLLADLFPTVQVLEEVQIPITRTEKLFLDFYINTLKVAIEVHGKQHYEFNTLFHTSAQDFANQRKRDRRKRDWCEYNNITYVELPYDEEEEKWKKRIQLRNA